MGFADRQAERKTGIMDRFDPLQNVKKNFRKLMSRRTQQASTLEERDSSNKFRSLALEDTCDVTWYDDYESVLFENNVFAVWKVQPELESATLSAFDKEVMSQICEAEVNTLKVMEDAKVCKTCTDGKCLPPLSLVLLLRQKLNDHDSSCADLMNAYTSEKQAEFTSELFTCTKEYTANFDSASLTPGDTPSCPPGFQMSVVDYFFGTDENDKLRYTSSFFYTSVEGNTEAKEKRINELYDVYLDFDGTDGSVVEGVYDTVYENFNTIYVDALVISDMVSSEYLEQFIIFYFHGTQTFHSACIIGTCCGIIRSHFHCNVDSHQVALAHTHGNSPNHFRNPSCVLCLRVHCRTYFLPFPQFHWGVCIGGLGC